MTATSKQPIGKTPMFRLGSGNEWKVNFADSEVNVIRGGSAPSATDLTPRTIPRGELDLLLQVCAECGTTYSTSDWRSHHCSPLCAARAKRRHGKARQARYREAHPTREQCRQVLKNAILLGKVRRPVRCEGCGEVAETEGHHEDYRKPFFVHWLCRTCHSSLEDGRHFGAGQAKASTIDLATGTQ